jgi:hypothetical protein
MNVRRPCVRALSPPAARCFEPFSALSLIGVATVGGGCNRRNRLSNLGQLDLSGSPDLNHPPAEEKFELQKFHQLRLIQFGWDLSGSRHFVPSTNLD